MLVSVTTGLGRIVFINRTQAISVVLHFGSQKCFFKPFFLQLIDKQRQQRAVYTGLPAAWPDNNELSRGWRNGEKRVSQSLPIRLVASLLILVILLTLGPELSELLWSTWDFSFLSSCPPPALRSLPLYFLGVSEGIVWFLWDLVSASYVGYGRWRGGSAPFPVWVC